MLADEGVEQTAERGGVQRDGAGRPAVLKRQAVRQSGQRSQVVTVAVALDQPLGESFGRWRASCSDHHPADWRHLHADLASLGGRRREVIVGTIAVGFAGTVPEFPVMMEQMLPLLSQSESEVKTVVEQWDADLARNASDRLPSVDKPPLMIGGEQDLAAPPWQCRKVPSGSRGPRRRSSSGRVSSHAVGLERTEEFLAEVLAFFAARPAPAATG